MPVIAERTPPDALGAGLPPVRLSLKPQGPQSGLLDGAWWPRSRDLAAELPALIAVLDPVWGHMTRVTVNPARWAGVPAEVTVAGRVVSIGPFTDDQDPETLLLRQSGVRRRDLLVVPPRLGQAAAARLMAAATDPQNVRTATELLAEDPGHGEPAAGQVPAESVKPVESVKPAESAEPVEPTDMWEDEGGFVPGVGPS
ncbi:DUF5994 family protein [Streptomyces axinellae]|uniref:DUF5994 family protein n=1 Tax=Streptomyces axinellae TaxID=552788 RepID=A0ABP6CAA8_9ACTN